MNIVQTAYRVWRRAAICYALLLFSLPASWSQPGPKKRVAVFDFYNATAQSGLVASSSQTVRATGNSSPPTSAPDVGRGISELLITKLVQDGSVSVIERNIIEKVLAEQNLGNSDRTDPAIAAKLGRVLGVDAIILGTITHYDYQEKMQGRAANAARNIARAMAHGGTSFLVKYDVMSDVEISARVISPDTAEVLGVAQGHAESRLKGRRADTLDPYGRVIMTSGANSSILNECSGKAVAQLAAELETQFGKLPPRKVIIEGVVADVSDSGRLVLNVGAQQGVKIGDRFQVLRAGEEVRDPVSGKVLMRSDTLLGEAVVTSVNDISCVAQYHGTEPPKVRDLVRSGPALP